MYFVIKMYFIYYIIHHIVFLLTVGTAVRHCSDEKGWLPPELFNCTTITFSHLKKLVHLAVLIIINRF